MVVTHVPSVDRRACKLIIFVRMIVRLMWDRVMVLQECLRRFFTKLPVRDMSSARLRSPYVQPLFADAKRDAVAQFFRVSHNRSAAFEPVNSIFPRHVAPVVRYAPDGEREIVTMSWGFMLLQQGRAPRPVTNVRDDKLRTSSLWRESFDKSRCLVPASSFCEPNGDVKPATWHCWARRKSGRADGP